MNGDAPTLLFGILNEDGPVLLARRQAGDTQVSTSFDHGVCDAVALQRGDCAVYGVAFTKATGVDRHALGLKDETTIPNGDLAVIHSWQNSA